MKKIILISGVWILFLFAVVRLYSLLFVPFSKEVEENYETTNEREILKKTSTDSKFKFSFSLGITPDKKFELFSSNSFRTICRSRSVDISVGTFETPEDLFRKLTTDEIDAVLIDLRSLIKYSFNNNSSPAAIVAVVAKIDNDSGNYHVLAINRKCLLNRFYSSVEATASYFITNSELHDNESFQKLKDNYECFGLVRSRVKHIEDICLNMIDSLRDSKEINKDAIKGKASDLIYSNILWYFKRRNWLPVNEDYSFPKVTFQIGQFEITPFHEITLKEVSEVFRKQSNLVLEVSTGVSEFGDIKKNLELSDKRLKNLRLWFIDNGVNSSTIKVVVNPNSNQTSISFRLLQRDD